MSWYLWNTWIIHPLLDFCTNPMSVAFSPGGKADLWHQDWNPEGDLDLVSPKTFKVCVVTLQILKMPHTYPPLCLYSSCSRDEGSSGEADGRRLQREALSGWVVTRASILEEQQQGENTEEPPRNHASAYTGRSPRCGRGLLTSWTVDQQHGWLTVICSLSPKYPFLWM